MHSEFGQAWTWDALRFNTLLFALARPVARTELVRQLATTQHDRRKAQLAQAIAEIDRRMKATDGQMAPQKP